MFLNKFVDLMISPRVLGLTSLYTEETGRKTYPCVNFKLQQSLNALKKRQDAASNLQSH